MSIPCEYGVSSSRVLQAADGRCSVSAERGLQSRGPPPSPRPPPRPPRGPGPCRAPGGGPGLFGVGAPGGAGPHILEGLPHRPRDPRDAPRTPAGLDPGGPPWLLQGLQGLDSDRPGDFRLVLLRGHPGAPYPPGPRDRGPPFPQRPSLSSTTCWSWSGRWGPGLGGLLSRGALGLFKGSRSHQRV
ncbi:collagen alpha-1(XVII) chain-like isoform X1 [Gadus macrocephalus]|uniref:collagen alpha-1(XVII) chain-like isoform X1 n=1 Tax=Gadus macrocephalus TaxID=80720 RepID=UPI0028CB82D4|nr:collagen alpha-1(XVII) chain-like isoform X1 [Gadus macrocephalus]